MDICAWIGSLPSSEEWANSGTVRTMELGCLKDEQGNSTKSLLIRAERTAGSSTEALITFSLCLQGFWPSNPHKTLWISNPCPPPANGHPAQEKTILPLLLQLVEEIITRAPTSQLDHRFPPLRLKSHVFLSHPPDSFSSFCNLVFLCRLFWLCVCDAPAEVGSLYFQTMASQLEVLFLSSKLVLTSFLKSMGADLELYFMRSLGYMFTKWLIMRELSAEKASASSKSNKKQTLANHSYTTQTLGGFWVLKGFAPLLAMDRAPNSYQHHGLLETRESVLRYALAHQQLEAVVQLEFSVSVLEEFVRVQVKVDNLRFNVAHLGFLNRISSEGCDRDDFSEEKHFPSRICVWVGPEWGSDCVASLSLDRSTDNPEREVEIQRTVKGSFGKSKFPDVKATARTATRTRLRNWNVEQSAEGNTAMFDVVLCDNTSGVDVATWRAGGVGTGESMSGFKKRYSGCCRAFNKLGGLVLASDEFGEGASWRLAKQVEGSVLKWRVGARCGSLTGPTTVKLHILRPVLWSGVKSSISM